MTTEEIRSICDDLTQEEFALVYQIPLEKIIEWDLKGDFPEYLFYLIGEVYYNRKTISEYMDKYEPWKTNCLE